MDKFKKAIEQLNKPIRETKRSVEITPVRRVERKSAPIVKPEPKQVIEPEREVKAETAQSPAEEMSEFEKELEAEFLLAHPESEAVLKRKEKEQKKKKAVKTVKATDDDKESSYGIRTIIAVAVIVLIAIGCMANIRLNNQLKPVFYQIQSSKVVENVRVVAISDMHLKEFGANNIRLVEKIKSYHPDIIAILGDMNIDDNPDYSAVINLCARLNNVAPLYYALGNHEFDAMLFKDSQIYYDMKAAGIKVLNNEVETVEVGLSTIDIIGVTQGPKRFREDAQKFFDGAMNETDNFKLVLTHYPENFKGTMEKYPIDLALCGHAHGGQVRLPVIGGLYSSDQGILPQLCDGYHEIENSKVIISKGLGRSGIVPRINNAPEITIVDINWY